MAGTFIETTSKTKMVILVSFLLLSLLMCLILGVCGKHVRHDLNFGVQ